MFPIITFIFPHTDFLKQKHVQFFHVIHCSVENTDWQLVFYAIGNALLVYWYC